MRTPIAALCLLLGCSGGDLTLPGSDSEPDALRIVAGDDQRAPTGTLLEQPLVVEVLDAASTPVAGSLVEFSFVGELPGAGLDPATVTTGADGRAAAVVRLGVVSGEQLIVARVSGTTSPNLAARFTAVAVGGGGDGDGDGKGQGKKGDGDADDDEND
jgi:hypothetical protein